MLFLGKLKPYEDLSRSLYFSRLYCYGCYGIYRMVTKTIAFPSLFKFTIEFNSIIERPGKIWLNFKI